jgi:ketosteroid isomerase-like protein
VLKLTPGYTQSQSAIEGRRLGKMIFHSITADDIRVRIYGNTAIVTGHTEVRGQHEGRGVAGDYRYTRVYLRKAGRWRVVSSHSTRIIS